MPQPRERIVALDGLRGVLALYVALFHLSAPLVGSGSALTPLAPLLHQAWFAVDLFFLMSGFVMMHVYGAPMRSGAPGSTRHFFRARAARLLPVNLAAMAAMALLLLLSAHDSAQFLRPDGRYGWSAGLASMLMLQSPWIDHRTWDYPAWSVSAECHAYLLFPLLAARVSQLSRRWALALVLLGVGTTLALYLSAGNAADLERFPTNGPVVLLRAAPLFVAGMATYSLRATGWLSRERLAIALLIALVLLLSVRSANCLAVIATPFVVLMCLQTRSIATLFGRRIAISLGRLSYSLYMTHALVETFLIGGVLRIARSTLHWQIVHSVPASTGLLAVAVAVSLGLAWLCWTLVEMPARRWLMQRAEAAPMAAALPVTST